MARRLAYWAMTVILVLLAVEVVLHLANAEATYSEQTGMGFVSYFNQVLPTWYYSWGPNKDIVYKDPDIECHFRTNALGVREREIPAAKPDSVKRLFFLGDSFVEGVGVQYPNSMPRDIEKKLDSAKLGYEVYNVGVSGSDPVYEYTQLRDQLLPLHPTHVIVGINGSDVMDILFRGGMERFHADGTTHYRKGSIWEPLYHYSRLCRVVYKLLSDKNDETFMSNSERKKQMDTAGIALMKALVDMKTLCDQHSIKMIVVAHPFPSYVTMTVREDDVLDMLKKHPAPQLPVINTFDGFTQVINKDNLLDYSWKINGHFNQKGYQLYADILFNKINQQYPQFWQ